MHEAIRVLGHPLAKSLPAQESQPHPTLTKAVEPLGKCTPKQHMVSGQIEVAPHFSLKVITRPDFTKINHQLACYFLLSLASASKDPIHQPSYHRCSSHWRPLYFLTRLWTLMNVAVPGGLLNSVGRFFPSAST